MQARSRGPAVACALAASIGVATCELGATRELGEVVELSLGSLGLEILLGCVAVAGALVSRRPVRERLGLSPGRVSRGSLALLVVGALGVSQSLDAFAELTGLRDQSSLASLEDTLAGAGGVALWIALLGLGIAPGLSEELLCRGLLQRGLVPRMGTPAAVLLSALVFGALHIDPVHALLATILGLYLGAAAALAGSTRTAIFCHCANNLVAVWFTARMPDLPTPGPGWALAGVVLGASCLITVYRRLPQPAPPAPPPSTGISVLQPEADSDDG